jgi:lipopolysaccharide transport system ATP-binding protein
MKRPIIEVNNLSKKYILGERQPYYSLRDSISKLVSNPKSIVKKETRADFWALRNISFNVFSGDVIGIIGGNGAGKSTLLKIISRITPPTKGSITLRGRVASLLEVGTGFHPELTGKENIYLNGAVLGMKRSEINSKFKTIVEFAEVERFLNTPVKHYSSGMYMRLAFAVAAHLEPEILLVDEVLAVGDAEFQNKCIGKMQDVASSGRTIIFVSHNMSAIQRLCQKSILIKQGKISESGPTSKIISRYLKDIGESGKISLNQRYDRRGNGKVRVSSVVMKNAKGESINFFRSGDDVGFSVEYKKEDSNIKKMDFALSIDDFSTQTRIAFISNKIFNHQLSVDGNPININIRRLPLTPGKYQFTIILVASNGDILDWIQKAGSFTVEYGDYYGTKQVPPQSEGSMLIDYSII